MMRRQKNNLFLFHFLTLFQIVVQMIYINKNIQNRKIKRSLIVSSVVLIIFLIINMAFFEKLSSYNSLAIVIKSSAISIFSILAVIDIFRSNDNEIIYLNNRPEFWILTGFLIQALGSFFFEGIMGFLIQKNNDLSLTFYFINVSIGLVLYILFIAGLFTRFKIRKAS